MIEFGGEFGDCNSRVYLWSHRSRRASVYYNNIIIMTRSQHLTCMFCGLINVCRKTLRPVRGIQRAMCAWGEGEGENGYARACIIREREYARAFETGLK